MTSVAVVGHVEWLTFAVVGAVPAAGEIVQAREVLELAAGGGGAAAVQLAKLAGAATFYTVLGDDELGRRARDELAAWDGLRVEATHRGAQRRAFTFLSDDHERTITVLGERHVPHGDDALAWDGLGAAGGVYFTGGDVDAVRKARAAKWLVATPRALDVLRESKVAIDVLVASASDEGERYAAGSLDPEPRFVVLTHGGAGGSWHGVEGRTGTWKAVAPPGEPVDSYGCGDAFAAGLTYGLAAWDSLERALELAARCGASVLCGRGPYEGQLDAP